MADLTIGNLGAQAFALTDLLEHEPLAGPPSRKGDINALVTLLNSVYGTGPFLPLAGGTLTGLLTIAQAAANTSNLILSGQSLTGANAQSLVDMAGTWNTTGAPTALKLDITNTDSGALSLLMDLQVGTTSMFKVAKGGDVTIPVGGKFIIGPGTGVFAVGNIDFLGNAYIQWAGRTYIESPADGNFRLNNAAGTGFGLIQLGGVTSSFPAIKRSAALLQARLADDSDYTDLEARLLRTTPGFTVATLPAVGTAGRRSYVTDAAAPAFGAAAVGGGAVVTPVFDNGAAWIVG